MSDFLPCSPETTTTLLISYKESFCFFLSYQQIFIGLAHISIGILSWYTDDGLTDIPVSREAATWGNRGHVYISSR